MPDKIGQGLVSSDFQIRILWAELALTTLTQSLQVPSVNSVYIPWVCFVQFCLSGDDGLGLLMTTACCSGSRGM